MLQETMDLRTFYQSCAGRYDADYAALGYADDVPFYVAMAQESGGPVLEMGCGTGRILLPTARAGIRIHGLDLSPAMLSRLREKLAEEPPEVQQRITVGEGDVRTARVDGQFTLVTAPFRVVQHLLERENQRAWLRNVARHLAPLGALCFDVFQPNFRLMLESSEERAEPGRVDAATGHRFRRYWRVQHQMELQIAECTFRWVEEDAAGAVLSETTGSFTFRWFTRGELYNLLELEGFRITDYWGTFGREPFGEGSPQQIIRAVYEGN